MGARSAQAPARPAPLSEPTVPTRRALRRKRGRAGRRIALGLLTLACLGSLTAIGSVTNALFSDSRDVNGGDVGTAAVKIGLEPGATLTDLSVADLAPAQSVVAPVTVTNQGTIQMRYSLTSALVGDQGADPAAAQALAAALKLDVRQGVATCDAEHFEASGTVLYGGASVPTSVTATNAAASDSAGSPLKLLGDAARGQQDGDRVLDPDASEQLCLRLTLPADAPNTTQSISSHLALTFSAEQTIGE